MEGSRMAPSARDNGFIARLVTDPKEPPKVKFLSGFAGSSSEEGHIRLYFDLQLTSHVEIPEAAILHRQDLSAAATPLGGTLLWIDSRAELIESAANDPRSEADFLEGGLGRACFSSIASGNQSPPDRSSSNGDTGGKQGETAMGNSCTTNFPNCQTAPQGAPAPTQAGCAGVHGADAGPTIFTCPTQVCGPTFFCPTVFCPTTAPCLPPSLAPLCGPNFAAPTPAQPAAVFPSFNLSCIPTLAGCPNPYSAYSAAHGYRPQAHYAQAQAVPQTMPTFVGCFLPPTYHAVQCLPTFICPQAAAPPYGPAFTQNCGANAAPAQYNVLSLLTLGCVQQESLFNWNC